MNTIEFFKGQQNRTHWEFWGLSMTLDPGLNLKIAKKHFQIHNSDSSTLSKLLTRMCLIESIDCQRLFLALLRLKFISNNRILTKILNSNFSIFLIFTIFPQHQSSKMQILTQTYPFLRDEIALGTVRCDIHWVNTRTVQFGDLRSQSLNWVSRLIQHKHTEKHLHLRFVNLSRYLLNKC